MSLRARLGAELRHWSWWRTLRRIQTEGASRAFGRWRQWSQVLATAPVHADVPGRSPVEVHLLCHRGDHLCAIWALKTLYRTSGARWPAVVHVQGPSTATMIRRFRRHIPDARPSSPGRGRTRASGRRCPNAIRGSSRRAGSRRLMKLIDPVLLANADRIVILDSGVLFFREASRALCATWSRRPPTRGCSSATLEHVQRHRGGCRVGVWDSPAERVNSGIAVVPRALVDLDLCERLLEHRTCGGPAGWIEPTLFRCVPARAARSSIWSPSYVISLERGLDYGAFTAAISPGQPPAADRSGHAVRGASRCLGLQSHG